MPETPMTAILERLEPDVAPDPAFASALFGTLEPRVRRARRFDASWLGRFVRLAPVTAATPPRRVQGLVLVTALLLVAALIAIALSGAQRRPDGPLAYFSGGEVIVQNADGTGRRVVGQIPGAGPYSSVALSPDGRHVAVIGLTNDGGPVHRSSEILVADLDTSASIELAIPGEGVPAWSVANDLAWRDETSSADGAISYPPAVHILLTGASEPVRWDPPVGSSILDLQWSPVGRVLAVLLLTNGEDTSLELLDAMSMTARQIGPAGIGDLAWSADGRTILTTTT